MDALFGLLSSSCWTVFLFLPSTLTLCVSLSLSLSLCPLFFLFILWNIGLDCRWNHKPTNPDFFFLSYPPSLTFSYTPLCQFLFFCAVVRVSGLFSFKLNTFQLCMNHTSHKSGYAKADVTELPLHVYVKCTWVLVRLCAHMKISR